MSDRIFRENIAHLTEQLAFEASASKRQQLARRIKKEIEKLAAVDHGPVTAPPMQNGDYWKSRAERTRQQARRYRSEGVRDHLLKIAAGYDELAKRAYAAQQTSETQRSETAAGEAEALSQRSTDTNS
ncbi:MAG TPA: hypothetical protein VHB49_17710 [Bradyrhizobium sp.]|nr:hypothetical protein [Bradyrhizobium sp.]